MRGWAWGGQRGWLGDYLWDWGCSIVSGARAAGAALRMPKWPGLGCRAQGAAWARLAKHSISLGLVGGGKRGSKGEGIKQQQGAGDQAEPSSSTGVVAQGRAHGPRDPMLTADRRADVGARDGAAPTQGSQKSVPGVLRALAFLHLPECYFNATGKVHFSL